MFSAKKIQTTYFFVETENGTVVIKASFTIASDLFASIVANRVGIFTPKMEIFSYLDSPRWDPMVQKLWLLEETHKDIDAGRGNKLSKCLMRLFLSIYEFVPGYDLSTLPDIYSPLLTAGSGPNVPLFQLGKVIALDIFLNNWDRFPFGNIWSNEGNSKNLMFQISSENEVVVRAIDNSITSITHQANFLLYQDRVKECVLNAHRSAKITREFILNNTNRIDIGDLGETLIGDGVKAGVKEISSLSISEILQMQKDCSVIVQPTLEMLGVEKEHAGVTRIDEEYLRGMLNLFLSLNEKLS